MYSGAGSRDILALIIDNFFFGRLSSIGDDSNGDLALLLQPFRFSFFVHNDPFHPLFLGFQKPWTYFFTLYYLNRFLKKQGFFDICKKLFSGKIRDALFVFQLFLEETHRDNSQR